MPYTNEFKKSSQGSEIATLHQKRLYLNIQDILLHRQALLDQRSMLLEQRRFLLEQMRAYKTQLEDRREDVSHTIAQLKKHIR